MNIHEWANVVTFAIGVAGIIGIIVAVFFVKRYEKMIRFLQTEIEARKDQVSRIESERNEYRDKLHKTANAAQKLEVENTELKSRTDLTAVTLALKEIISAISKTNERLDQQQRDQNELFESHRNVCSGMTDALRDLVHEVRKSRGQ